MIERVSLDFDPSQLQEDLKRYLNIAKEQGATAVSIVTTDQIVLDERVRMKCRFPLCEHYGASMNCPPHTGSVGEMRSKISLYKFAIVFKLDFPSERIVAPSSEIKDHIEGLRHIVRIVSAVESAAFYDGYYYATGFASASCRITWCRGLECQALQGRGCRFQSRSYASMESVGMDVFRLATSLGWDIYPIGKSVTADMVPHGTRLGLILIA